MLMNVQAGIVIRLKDAFLQPFLEGGCSAGIAVVRLSVRLQFATELYADEVRRAAMIEFLLKSGADNIIRRTNDIGQVIRQRWIIVYTVKRANIRQTRLPAG